MTWMNTLLIKLLKRQNNMATVNLDFSTELKKYGTENFEACYNCGTCTAVCSLSTEDDSFPREMVRFSVLGMESDIESSLKPWLCYYCGECSDSCPREANPGELMMGLRRWLTAKYDWTGLSGLLYKSLPLTLIAFVLIIVGVIAFTVLKDSSHETLMHYGHLFEIISIGCVFSIILLPNIVRMWWFTIIRPKVKVPFISYFKGIWEFLLHMFTQKQSLSCEDDDKFRWFEHLILVFSYLALLFTTIVLDWFGTENIFIIILGYVESVIICIVTIDFVSSRIKKNREVNKFSQPSDWFFVIWLFLLGFSSFIVRVFIDLDLLETNFWIYLFHIIVLAQWALVIVPFGKWTHFLYRPFAIYFASLEKAALERQYKTGLAAEIA